MNTSANYPPPRQVPTCYILMMALLMGCSGKDLVELREATPVLTATLTAGSTSDKVAFFTLDKEGTDITPITDAAIILEDENGNSGQLLFVNQSYTLPEGFEIQPEKTYHLSTTFGEKEISASCVIPPQIELESITNDTFNINPSSTGTVAGLIQWTELDQGKYAYVLQLENLEEEKNEIPFTAVPGGNFEALHNGPRVQPGIILYDTDFKYYGLHRLTVTAIDRELETIYFFNSSDIRGLLQNSPDNITGARGFFTGVSRFAVELFVQ